MIFFLLLRNTPVLLQNGFMVFTMQQCLKGGKNDQLQRLVSERGVINAETQEASLLSSKELLAFKQSVNAPRGQVPNNKLAQNLRGKSINSWMLRCLADNLTSPEDQIRETEVQRGLSPTAICFLYSRYPNQLSAHHLSSNVIIH